MVPRKILVCAASTKLLIGIGYHPGISTPDWLGIRYHKGKIFIICQKHYVQPVSFDAPWQNPSLHIVHDHIPTSDRLPTPLSVFGIK